MALGAAKPGSFTVGAKKAAAPAASASKVVAGKKPAAAVPSGKKVQDFTWGGRPNPTPETRVEEKESFLSAAWRYNAK